MRRMFRRQAVPAPAQSRLQTYAFRSPVKGWVSNTNLSAGMKDAALVLDNWFPTKTGARLRGGHQEFNASAAQTPILSAFTYRVSGVSKLFVADDDKIYNITSTPSTDISGLTSGYFSTQQMETAGGSYLLAANGTDNVKIYDGSSWANASFTGPTSSTLSCIWAYRNRLWFVQGGTMVAWYLDTVDAVSGAASDFTLRGVFQNGGSLLFGATWSVDAGAGLDDYIVFVSDTGEVAVFSGDDPGAANWTSVGRYELGGQPLGKNATMRVGGDLLIATTDGLVPISSALKKDPVALSLDAVSYPIEPDWRREAIARISLPWTVTKWPEKNMALITNPVVDGTTDAQCFVVNLETGAWCRYTGWDARCAVVHNGTLYFGTSDGRTMVAESEANDDGSVYVAKCAWHFADMGAPAMFKTAMQGRATFRAAKPFIAQLSCSVDYAQSFPSPPSSVEDYSVDEWDSGLWDEALWDGSTSATTTSTRWVSITGAGFTHAPQIQITCGTTPLPDAEVMRFDMTFQSGGLAV